MWEEESMPNPTGREHGVNTLYSFVKNVNIFKIFSHFHFVSWKYWAENLSPKILTGCQVARFSKKYFDENTAVRCMVNIFSQRFSTKYFIRMIWKILHWKCFIENLATWQLVNIFGERFSAQYFQISKWKYSVWFIAWNMT